MIMYREVKEVPEDSEEAKTWPRWQPPQDLSTEEAKIGSTSAPLIASSSIPEASSSTVSPSPNEPTPPSQPTSSTSLHKPKKKPGPRKSKITPLVPTSSKPKKLTTLDKSAMDWRSHVETEQPASGLKDDLEANRRGGGYLEKVEFLKRVEERKEEAFESSKSGKRRRP